MADATINLKLTPAEFDLIREVLDRDRQRAMNMTKSQGGHESPKLRAEQRELAVKIGDILSRLK